MRLGAKKIVLSISEDFQFDSTYSQDKFSLHCVLLALKMIFISTNTVVYYKVESSLEQYVCTPACTFLFQASRTKVRFLRYAKQLK